MEQQLNQNISPLPFLKLVLNTIPVSIITHQVPHQVPHTFQKYLTQYYYCLVAGYISDLRAAWLTTAPRVRLELADLHHYF